MSNEMDEVYDGVYIASIQGARTTSMDDFDAVVTTCQDSIEDHIPDDVDYHFFNMADGPSTEDMWGGRSDYEIFESAASTMLEHINSGDTVLVHCHHGQSRSASVAIAALAAHYEANYYEVHSNVESQRPQIHPDGLLADHARKFIEERTDVRHRPSGFYEGGE